MTELEFARTQFGITTIYHFLFVPMTIGLSLFVALCQTLWLRIGNDVYRRATLFWGKLMLISFDVGSLERSREVLGKVRLMALAESLGGVLN